VLAQTARHQQRLPPPQTPSLAVQLQGHEPTFKQKIIASRASKALCFVSATKEQRTHARALTRTSKDGGSTAQTAELLHGLLQLDMSAQDQQDLKATVNTRLGDKEFAKRFARVASMPTKDTVIRGQWDGGERYRIDTTAHLIEPVVNDEQLAPVLDRIFEPHIAARVAAALGGSGDLPVVHNARVERMIALKARESIRLAMQDSNPLHSVLDMREAVDEDVLAHGFRDTHGNLQNDKVAELFQGLLDAATTDVDKAVLKRCVQDVLCPSFVKDIAELAGRENNSAAKKVANHAEMKPFLNSAFAAQIAAGVAARTGGSSENVHPAKISGPLGLLVEARIDDQIREIKRTALINKHPIQVALDIREFVPSDSYFWEEPILTSYDTPCAEDVVALLGELSQAATTATDKFDLRQAIGKICHHPDGFWLDAARPIKALADSGKRDRQDLCPAYRRLCRRPRGGARQR
jgi:hypothetical protein